MLPSTFATMKYGAGWFSAINCMWGAVSMSTAAVRSVAQLMALRVLLGLAQAGQCLHCIGVSPMTWQGLGCEMALVSGPKPPCRPSPLLPLNQRRSVLLNLLQYLNRGITDAEAAAKQQILLVVAVISTKMMSPWSGRLCSPAVISPSMPAVHILANRLESCCGGCRA